ncbi:unnamed protein product, partial [Mesorhabditis belari]|uniref:Uncharacterized protein n=1 Tax=Mesorhabditis belari TaxID=2138241 RepID=A0AAF3EZT1_9BILA
MSESSFGGGSGSLKEENDEEYDENVEEIDTADCSQRLTRILIQFGLSLFVLGCMAGALVWSFNNGEKGTDNGGKHENHRDASVNFTIFVDQWAMAGTCTVTTKSPDGPNNKENSQEYESFWYQDDKHKRIVHRIDDKHTLYVRENFTFNVEQEEIDGEVQHCAYEGNLGYDLYIERSGLTNLIKHYSDIEKTKNHAQVYVYEGDPSKVSLLNYGDAVAFLITAYADSSSGALLGWETYFESDGTDNHLYMAAYWYDEMSLSTPDETVFSIPKECQTIFQMQSPSFGDFSSIQWKEPSLSSLHTNRLHPRKKHRSHGAKWRTKQEEKKRKTKHRTHHRQYYGN